MPDGSGPPLDGRYELRRPLGGSPAAEVLLAHDLQLDRPVAVKLLDAGLSRDPAVVERFRRAVADAATLRGPNVVTVYDWGESGGRPYVTMELVDGESLATRLEHARQLDLGTVAAIGIGIARALEVAHAAGQVHGSLTPRDVLLARDGGVKVTDFGSAAAGLASSETSPEDAAVFGAPEQLRGAPPEPASDLYSLGTILVAATTGAPPFTGDAVTVTRRKLEEAAPPASRAVPGLPPAFDAITARLLERDPARRYGSATEVVTDLERLRETVVVEAAPPTRPVAPVSPTAVLPVGATTLPPDSSRRRSATPWIVAAIVVLVLIVGGLVAWAVTRDDEQDAEQVAVPAVVGLRVADANAALVDVGLSPSTVDEPNEEFAAGLVFSQAPAAATTVRKGSVVVLKVSAGPTTTSTTSTSTTSTTTTSTTSTTTTSTTTTTTTTTTPP